jgi:hypothetical protein
MHGFGDSALLASRGIAVDTDLPPQPQLRHDLVALRLGDGLPVGRSIGRQDALQVGRRHAALLLLLLRRLLLHVLHGAWDGGAACGGSTNGNVAHNRGG